MLNWWWVIAFLVVLVVVEHWIRQRKKRDPSQGAAESRELNRKLFVPEHEYAPARLSDFPHLDHKFYDEVAREGEALGFRHLGDIEDKTLTRAKVGARTVVRNLVSDEGIVLACYQAIATGWTKWFLGPARNVRAVDLMSELSDRMMFMTTTAWVARHLEQPALIKKTFHPYGTPIAELLEDHRAQIAKHLSAHPEVTVLKHGTLEELLDFANRENRIMAAFKAGKGYAFSRAELMGLASESKLVDISDAADQVANATEREDR